MRRAVWLVALSSALAGCDHGPEIARPASVDDVSVSDARAFTHPPVVARVPAVTAPSSISSHTLRVSHAPFADHPDVFVALHGDLVHAAKIPVVLFLHGWYGCVDVVAGHDMAPCTEGSHPRYAMDVLGEFTRSGVTAMLVIPQLAFDRASCDPGALGDRGGWRALVRDVLDDRWVEERIGRRDLDAIGPTILFAHSGALIAAGRVLDAGGLPVDEVHLLDALYRETPAFDHWIDRRFRRVRGVETQRFTVIYTDREGTGARSRALFARHASVSAPHCESRTLAMPSDEMYDCSVMVARVPVAHEDVPRVFVHRLLETADSLREHPLRDGGAR